MTKEQLKEEMQKKGWLVVSEAGNKIEFNNGETFAKDTFTGLYKKVKNFVL